MNCALAYGTGATHKPLPNTACGSAFFTCSCATVPLSVALCRKRHAGHERSALFTKNSVWTMPLSVDVCMPSAGCAMRHSHLHVGDV